MKQLSYSLIAAFGLLATVQAGETTYSTGKGYKQPTPVAPTSCFADRELQIDTFGQASFGSSDKTGLFKDNAYGGGIGLNYFFHRNIGLGLDAAWLDAKESSLGNSSTDNERTVLHNVSASLILRMPIDSACLAPYAYVGGGYHGDGHNWGSGHVGAGLEYRVVPNKVGVFVDGRWTYLGDRFEEKNLNFWTVRAGLRLVF